MKAGMYYIPGCLCDHCKAHTEAAEIRQQELLTLARKVYDALTPEQRTEHDRQQRISWVAGTLQLGGVPEEQALAIAKTTVRQAERKDTL